MIKLPRGRFPNPERARRTLFAALKEIRSKKDKLLAGIPIRKMRTKDGLKEVPVRVVSKRRVAKRLDELQTALLTVQDAIQSKRYKLGFKGLAKLQRKERERARWQERQKAKQLRKERLLARRRARR